MRTKDAHRGRFHVLAVVSLGLLTLPLFLYTVHLRAAWFGVLSDSPLGHQWLTGGSLKFARNWYREGILPLRFAMIESPASVEFSSLQSRHPYASYPPGSILPIYLLARVLGEEPNPRMAMAYNLANHALIAWLLGVTAYVVLLRAEIPPLNALLFAAACPCVELLCPAPLYFHQNVYAMDVAVILPFVLCLLLESIRPIVVQRRLSRWLEVFQWCVFCAGYLTDWLFVFVGLTIYAKRLLLGELVLPHSRIAERHGAGSLKSFVVGSVWYWSPAMVAASLFVTQLTYLGWWGALYQHFRMRVGAMPQEGQFSFAEFLVVYPRRYLPLGYGWVGSCLLVVSILLLLALMAYALACRVRRRPVSAPAAVLVGFLAMVILPCCLQVLALRGHSGHTFSILKFTVPLAMAPFVLLPAVGVVLISTRRPHHKPSNYRTPQRRNAPAVQANPQHSARLFSRQVAGLNLAMLLAAGLYLYTIYPQWLSLFPAPSRYFEELTAAFAGEGIGYRDIVVSPDFEIPETPPQCLSYTMKRVYQCSNQDQLAQLVAAAEPPLRIVVLWVRGSELKARAWQIATASEIAGTLQKVAPYLDGRDGLEGEIASYAGHTVHFGESQFAERTMGAELFARRQYHEAIHVFAPDPSRRPGSPEACYWAGMALAQLGRNDEAIKQFELALRMDPNHAAAEFSLGDLLVASNPRLATDHYLAGLRLEPNNAAGLNGLGICLAQNGRIREAIALFRKAVEADPNDEAARRNLAAAMQTTAPMPRRSPAE